MALSFLPIIQANWSMIPEFKPTNSFSVLWPILAKAMRSTSRSNSSFKMMPISISIAALDDKPEPDGKLALM